MENMIMSDSYSLTIKNSEKSDGVLSDALIKGMNNTLHILMKSEHADAPMPDDPAQKEQLRRKRKRAQRHNL